MVTPKFHYLCITRKSNKARKARGVQFWMKVLRPQSIIQTLP